LDETAPDSTQPVPTETLSEFCLAQGFGAPGCGCFTSGLESVAAETFINEVVHSGDDLAVLGAFGFSLRLLADGCQAAATSLDPMEPSQDLVEEMTTNCAASGYFDGDTCRCIAAGISRGLTEPERTELLVGWRNEFDPYPIDRLASGCSHLVFEIHRARMLGTDGLPPTRPGIDDPGVQELIQAAQSLPAVAAQTETELFEQVISTCYLLDNGETPESLIGYFLASGDYETFRGSLVVLIASGTVCAEHRDAIGAAIDSLES